MLYIVGTPIGNLKDLSERMRETLASVELIIMESPTDSKRLLQILGITKKEIRKLNDENIRRAIPGLIQEMQKKDVAYITSAGMPSISDPGALLVKTAREKKIQIQVVPGPSAVTTALAGSGILTHEFSFIGFLPRKSGHIEKIFKQYADRDSVLIFFESPFRIVKTITILERVIPDAYVCVAKELTKMFENYFTGTPSHVRAEFEKDKKNTKGEFTVVVDFRHIKHSSEN